MKAMFEIEVVHARLGNDCLPGEVREWFARDRRIEYISPIKWEEHCTECAYPACYTTCDLYNARSDANCRRTMEGFSPVGNLSLANAYAVRVRFLRWCMFTARCSIGLIPFGQAAREEDRLAQFSLIAARMPDVGKLIGRPGLASRGVRRLKNKALADHVATPPSPGRRPDAFLIEVYNPQPDPVDLSIDLSQVGGLSRAVPFKRLEQVAHGINEIRIPFDEIEPHLRGSQEIYCAITPNILDSAQEGITLYFGIAAFVSTAADPDLSPLSAPVGATVAGRAAPGSKVKVLVWDLDNTLWDGTLIEDGPGRVALRPGVAEIVRALDARGIVNSIASKNYEDDALAELDRMGLREYFVHPMISWRPKGEAIGRIRDAFGIGADTIAFVDDQPFERAEVAATNPQVQIFSPEDLAGLLDRDEFRGADTDEARSRRQFYQNEAVRQSALRANDGEYLDFLRQSNIRVRVERPSEHTLDRVHELIQRTNQMNFSGTRYARNDLVHALCDPRYDSYLIEAEDKFGRYGHIGFARVRTGLVPRVVEMTFSCRVQSKRVEHAFLLFLMRTYAEKGHHRLEVFRKVTERNAQVAQVFDDLGFDLVAEDGPDRIHAHSIPPGDCDEDVVKVEWKEG